MAGAHNDDPLQRLEGTAPERLARLRLMFLALSVITWALIIALRLLYLQVIERKEFLKLSARQSERTIKLDPRRGSILDRDGAPLALSVEAESIYAVPQDIDDPERTTTVLSRILGLDAAARRDLLAKLQKPSAFEWVRRKVDPVTATDVRSLQLDGIGLLREARRYYPQRELASQVVGWVGVDNAGMSGIEYGFDETIRGRAQKVVIQTDARRRPVEHIEKPSTEGHTVVLTIDSALQFVVEAELATAVADTQSVAGVAVVLDPWTGEVLAMAGRPTFNPNKVQASSPQRWRNRVVADAYEPGSIFKIVTAAAGLQEKVVGTEETLDCGSGGLDIAGIRINDHAVFDRLTFRMAVAKSSDVGMIRVAQRLGRETFYRYVRDFGFGAPTGIDLPGESVGLLRPTQKWSALSLPSMSFGQEVGVTALQMALATAAVANGGYLMKPLVVRRVEDPSGQVVKDFKPLAVRRVLEESTTDTLTDVLKTVVKEGTGRRAQIPGYTVAGKTGTAQKLDSAGRYSMTDHVASFVGFVPASHPAFVILTSLDMPRGLHNQGGDIAAPLFARIAQAALRLRAVPPEDPDRVLRASGYATGTARPAAYRPSVAPPLAPETDDPRLMPDLRGRSARDAALAAARRGLVVELSGSGRVVSQSPEPGAEIESGATCRFVLVRRPGREVTP